MPLFSWLSRENHKTLGDASRFSPPYLNPTLTETIYTIQIIAKGREKASSWTEDEKKRWRVTFLTPHLEVCYNAT